MKIGIDAKWFFSGIISGRLFIQNVLPELIALHPEIEWHVFLNAKEKNMDLPFKNDHVKVHYVWAGFNMLSNLFVVPRFAKRLNLDAVLFQTFSPGRKSFKSVVFVHDVLFNRYPQYFTWKEKLYFKPLKWTVPAADRIITTTNYVQGELVRFNYAKNDRSMDIAPSGVTNIFKPLCFHDNELQKKIKLKFNLPDTYLLFVGRLNARKNIENLIESFRFINDKNICLVIAGEKNRKSSRTDLLLNEEKIRSKVYFTGCVADDELCIIYAMAKIFCFPSFAEGMGLPPLEAMASGIPVVVSNTTSMPEVCGKAALYADPSDP
ncbi:MAG TPA: glycosyltransferase family 1 protein, partial [Chitinophagaceae bacterium]|nr:glycosyltransferase family 1 protein [Chitinophagaceae bacterium]